MIFLSCEDKTSIDRNNKMLDDSIRVLLKNIEKVELDSSKVLLFDKLFLLNNKITIDSIRFKNNDSISDMSYKLNLLSQNKFILDKSLIEYNKKNDTLRIIKSYKDIGNYYLKKNSVDSAFYFFDKIEKYYTLKNDFVKVNEITLKKSLIKFKEGDYLGCETSLFKSLPITKKENNLILLNVSYTLLGLCKMELKEFDDAFYFLNLSIKYAKQIDEEKMTVEIAYNNIALSFLNKGDYNNAIKYYNKIIFNEKLKNNNYQVYIFSKQNIIYSKFKLGDIQNFEKQYEEILEGYKKLNLSPIQPLTQLSEFYESQKNIKKAQQLALEAYNISNKEKLYRDKLIALKQLTNIFPEKAKFYSTEYIKLSDSIATVDKKIQNTFARIEYRVDELSNENILLEERNKRIIFYSVIVLLMFSLFYFYRWQKQKQREFLLVQEQQNANEQVYNLMINQQVQMDKVKAYEQKRISQELHDGVLGKLFGARMNLDILNNKETEEVKKDKQKYIHEIIEVEKQIRQISHELNDDKRAIINNYQLLLDRFVEDQETLLKLKIDYSFTNKIPWGMVTAEEKINLYRIIQESFQNINKYAEADKVTFSVEYFDNKLKVSILDDGIGFDVKKASKRKGNGIGIKNMKDRANLINAFFKIESELFNGTRTQIILHINPNNEF